MLILGYRQITTMIDYFVHVLFASSPTTTLLLNASVMNAMMQKMARILQFL
jgi:hypothetical protein